MSSWKLPAYSGAFSLIVEHFSFSTLSWNFFTYNFSVFIYSWSFFAYNGNVRLISALRDCKQRSLTVSKRAPTVSKKAPPPLQTELGPFFQDRQENFPPLGTERVMCRQTFLRHAHAVLLTCFEIFGRPWLS